MYQSGRLELAAVTNHPESQCLVRSQLIFQLHPVSWLLYTGYIIQCPSSLQDPNSEGSVICHIEGVREKSKKNCGDHSLTLQCCPGLRVEVDHLNSAEFNKAGTVYRLLGATAHPFCNSDKELTLLPCLFSTSQ